MNDDLVHRLRAAGVVTDDGDNLPRWGRVLCRNTADEIERLRAENEALWTVLDEARTALVTVSDEHLTEFLATVDAAVGAIDAARKNKTWKRATATTAKD